MVYDESTKNIRMTFHGSSLSDAIRKLIGNADRSTAEKLPTGTNNLMNVQRNLGNRKQVGVFGIKKDAIGRQIRVNDEPPQRPPIQTSLTAVGGPRFPMWYRIKKHGTTSQSGNSRGSTQTTRLWPAGVSTYAAAQSQGNQHPQGDGQRTPKNPRDRLTDVFGEPLFGIESGEH